MTPAARIAELEAETADQREQIAALVARVQELEARLAKDSHTSAKPPSSDGLGRKTKSLRRTSGKQSGGQVGHRGETLRLVATPDAVVEHHPARGPGCQAPLAADAPVLLRERRQVLDLPRRRLCVSDHQARHVRCPACQAVGIGTFPSAAPSRVQYGPRLRALCVSLGAQQLVPYGRVRELLGDVFAAPRSEGTLVAWGRRRAATVAPVEAQIKAALGRAAVLHVDETGVRRGGGLAWAHVSSTRRLTHDAVHAKRGREAIDAIGLLPDCTGVSVHDGWKPYRAYQRCRHALCTIHHLRELTFVEEQYHQGWAAELKALQRAMKAAVEWARASGLRHLPAAAHEALITRYRALLASGHAAHPPPARRPRQRGRVKQTPAQNLLERLRRGQDEVLAFLDDFTIPFDNNQAERDLRLLKLQQKVSGSFRSDRGADAFARLRGYLSTLRKQGVALLAALETVLAGQPLYPAFA
jgi:transposase